MGIVSASLSESNGMGNYEELQRVASLPRSSHKQSSNKGRKNHENRAGLCTGGPH